MRHILLALLCTCAAAPLLHAQSDWAAVRSLSAGAELHVSTSIDVACTVQTVNDDSIVCFGQHSMVSIPRPQVRRVVLDAGTYGYNQTASADEHAGRHVAWYALAGAGLGVAGAAGAGLGAGANRSETIALAGTGAAIGATIALIQHAHHKRKGQVIYIAP